MIDHLGRATVSWERVSTVDVVQLRRWNGCVWEDLGGSASGAAFGSPGYAGSLALDPQDRPVVAWKPNDCDVLVARWSGAGWESFGRSLEDGGINHANSGGDPSLAVGPDGNPVVSRNPNWTGYSGFLVDRFDGSRWVSIAQNGGGCFAGSPYPIAIGDGGEPVVATYSGGSVPYQTFAWNGATWQQLGTLPNGSSVPSLAADARGLVQGWLAYVDGGYQIALLQWNGSAWTELAGSATGGGVSNIDGGARGPDIGNPSVAGWTL